MAHKSICILFTILLFVMPGCKKAEQIKNLESDPCDGVICYNGGNCVNGICMCDSGWTGTHCEAAVFDPAQMVQGYYLVSGLSYFHDTHGGGSTNITDDTLHIIRTDIDSIETKWNVYRLAYDSTSSISTEIRFIGAFSSGNYNGGASATFFDNTDSIYFHSGGSYDANHSSGITLSGRRIQ